jgi:hypothetical protein
MHLYKLDSLNLATKNENNFLHQNHLLKFLNGSLI